MQQLNKKDIQSAFATYLQKQFDLTRNEAELCAMSLFESESYNCFLYEEYLGNTIIEGNKFEQRLAYIDFEREGMFQLFKNQNPIFCFYCFTNENITFYDLDVDDEDVKSTLGEEWSCKEN